MSEVLEKVRGIDRLPIFPLPLVMLPNELLPLHIFEDRYRQMLADIQATNKMFGLSYFEPDESFIEKPAAETIGCVAEVRDVQELPDGRSNIITNGLVRYRLKDYVDTGDPYLVADVEFFEDEPFDSSVVGPLADDVFSVFERIAKAAFKMSGNRGRFPEIERTDPERFSFLAAAAFNFQNDLKYELLETLSTADRLEILDKILRKTVDQMEEGAGIHAAAQTNGHSKKKIDL